MRQGRIAAALVAALVMTDVGQAAQAQQDDEARAPDAQGIQLSPDGSRLALLGDDPAHPLEVRDTITQQPIYVGNLGPVTVRAIRWAGPHHLLIVTEEKTQAVHVFSGSSDYFLLTDLDVDAHKVHELKDDAYSHSLNTIRGAPTVLELNGRPVVFVQSVYFPPTPGPGSTGIVRGYVSLYRIDLGSGDSERVEVGAPDTARYIVGLDGHAVGRVDRNPRSGRWTLMIRTPTGWKMAFNVFAPANPPVAFGLGREGRSILFATRDGQNQVLHEASLQDGSVSTPADAGRAGAPVTDEQTGVVLGFHRKAEGGTAYAFAAPADQSAWDALAARFPGEDVRLRSWSADRRFAVVQVKGARDGSAYFLVDQSKPDALKLADARDH